MEVVGKRILIRLLSPEDVSQDYIDWMKDDEVVRFLESRWNVYTLEELREYVRITNESQNDFLFGILLKDTGKHIGNIKVGGINRIHRFGDIGLLIGDKSMWGKGCGKEAIELATTYAFMELGLNKLVAGIYANNIGSHKAFLKAGYREVGVLKNHRFCKGQYVDEILVEKCRG